MRCKAKDKCNRKAEYEFHGIMTCKDCLVEYIGDELLDEVIEDYIDMNATKLHKGNVKRMEGE